jgi:hypothetical protein
MGILFLVDEDMGPSIATPLRRMNHTATLVTEILGEGAPDVDVCKLAEVMGATVVTRNGKDYFKILERHDGAADEDFRKAGCLVLACPTHDVARKRLRQFRAVWELEHQIVTREKDCRALVEITPEELAILR